MKTRIWQCEVDLGRGNLDQSGKDHADAAGAEQEAREWFARLSKSEQARATATVCAYDVGDDGDMVSVPGSGRTVEL